MPKLIPTFALTAGLLLGTSTVAAAPSSSFVVQAQDRTWIDATNRWATQAGLKLVWRCSDCGEGQVPLDVVTRTRLNNAIRASEARSLDQVLVATVTLMNSVRAHHKQRPLFMYLFHKGNVRAFITDDLDSGPGRPSQSWHRKPTEEALP
jgi:hypothetical protein